MPETLPAAKKKTSTSPHMNKRQTSGRPPQVKFRSALSHTFAANFGQTSLISTLRQAYVRLKDGMNAFVISKNITVCLSIIFINAFSRQSGSVFIQCTSKLLGWPVSTAGYLLSIKALVSLGVLIALAGITRLLESRCITRPLYLDIWIARFSLTLLVVGNLLIGLSWNTASLITGE